MQSNFKRNLIISSGISVLILLISSIASYFSIQNLLDSNKQVNRTQDIIYNLNAGTTVMVEAQTSVRGFLITGRTTFLTEYKGAEQRTRDHFKTIRQLKIDGGRSPKNVDLLEVKSRRFYQYLDKHVDNKTKGMPLLALSIDEGKRLMAELRSTVETIENEEQLMLSDRLSTSNKFGDYSLLLIIAAAIIAMIISVVFFIRTLRDYAERSRLQAELVKKDQEMAARIEVISNISGEIARGNYDRRVEENETDALGSVGTALNNMAQSLEESFTKLSHKEWLQAGIAQLNNVMIGEKDISQLTSDIIKFLAEYTNSAAGVIYLPEGENLKAAAGYCYVASPERQQIRVGEGITGEAYLSGKIIQLKTSTPENITVSYALGEIKPTHILAIPLINESISGVVEMASVEMYTEMQVEFFNAVGNNIAIALKAAANRARVQELLEETQTQSEELSAQHSELESINAELEAQTEKLQASEEELRVQQEELQQTNEELAERSVLLEERNMEIQKKSEDLELTTRYKSEFLANMSHELRTPLNSILLLSRLLSENNEKNMNGEQVEFARVIQSSGNGLLALIDEILDLSKIEAGKMELEVLDVSTSEITSEMHNLFFAVAKEKNIDFKISAEKAPLVIKTDKMRLEQILKNLISNAMKFTAKGAVTLDIRRHPQNEKLISFTVRDTGIGIPRDKQHLVFEAFQQADGSTKRKFGGTGLGLSISRELAKLLKGEITLNSEPGKGSEFTLTIPIVNTAIAHPVEELVQSVPAEAKTSEYISPVIPEDVDDDRETVTPNDKTILIVEDDVSFAKSLLKFTRERGYKGIVTVRGDHALNLALVFKPRGILLDIQLPIKSGWEVMEELKNNSQTKHIPVHIMSSHKLKQESLLKGAVNFLDKPVAYEQMPDVFKRIEYFVNRESQKVLIIEDNSKHAKALSYFLETNNINSEIKSEVKQGVQALQNNEVDCVILDMGIPDQQAYEILERVKESSGLENLPIIVFTGKSLSMQEELKIKKYADSIIVKTAHSYQRMLDEVSLFLHLVEENKQEGNNRSKIKKQHMMSDVLSGKTVLVVDDDVRNIYSLTKSLEILKMNVLTAIDGREALTVLQENPQVDVVLLDMMMPNMDGYETASRIRENKKHKNLPVIAVTAKAMTGDREKCISAGASDYITKPVDVDQLLSLLRVWLYDK
ncbi:MAG: response regulator [Flavobacterium sp.]|nr:response regulator [Flavobacterium sp.]